MQLSADEGSIYRKKRREKGKLRRKDLKFVIYIPVWRVLSRPLMM